MEVDKGRSAVGILSGQQVAPEAQETAAGLSWDRQIQDHAGEWVAILVTSDPLRTHQGGAAGHSGERFGQVWALQLQLL